MKILAAIRREKRKPEKQVGKLQRELEGLTAAARVLGNSAAVRLDNAQKRVMSCQQPQERRFQQPQNGDGRR